MNAPRAQYAGSDRPVISIRLEQSIVDHFKAAADQTEGKGYGRLIEEALSEHIENSALKALPPGTRGELHSELRKLEALKRSLIKAGCHFK